MAPEPRKANRLYRFQEFEFDPLLRILKKDGAEIKVTPKALDLLATLIERAGEVVEREDLTSAVWPGLSVVEPGTIQQTVFSLRKALGNGENGGIVQTVPRRGYRLAASVTIVDDGAGEPVASVPKPRRLAAIGAAAALVAVAVSAVYWSRPHRPKPEAMAAYIRGRVHWQKREETHRAASEFRSAMAIDPGFALAHVGLADCLAFDEPPSYEALREVQTALRMEPELGEAYASLGYIQMVHFWQWKEAGESLRRSLALAPAYATGRHWYGVYLMNIGRLEEARAELREAARLDPESVAIRTAQGQVEYFAGRYESALELLNQAQKMDPRFTLAQWQLWRVFAKAGFGKEMVQHYMTAYWGAPDDAEAGRAAYEKGGISGFWEEICEKRRTPDRYHMAECYGFAGRNERALEALEHAVAQHGFFTMYMKGEPAFAALRSTARFQDLVRRMNYP
jgi:DNA-binding winged helix-turn-helix (wHTH) protein